MFVNPGGPGSSGVGLRARALADDLDDWGEGRFDVVSWDPRGTNRSTPVNCFTSDASAGPVLGGGVDPLHAGRVEGLPAQDRRTGATVRRGERRPPGPHLDCRHRPRSGRPAPPRRGRPADLRGPVLRDGDRPDLHQPVPGAGAGHGARRHRGPGRVHDQRRDAGRQPGARRSTRSSPRSWTCARARGAGHCALAGHGETVAQRVARVFDHRPAVVDPGAALRPARRPRLRRLHSRRLQPAPDPSEWAGFAAGPQCRGGGRRIETGGHGAPSADPGWVRRRDHVVCDLVPRRSRPQALAVLAQCHPEVHRRRARCTDRCWGGGCGRRARRTGRRAAPIGMPARGAPRPRRRSS